MYCTIKTIFSDKEVLVSENDGPYRKVSIFGMASFRVSPKRIGLGRLSLDLYKRFCEQKGKYAIMGFVKNDSILSFYLKCGWFECGKFDGLKAISSKPVKAKFKERW